VRAADLTLDELVHFDDEAGVFRFVGQRSLVVDVVALGLLRKHLVETLGVRGAREFLTRFGFVQGWRLTELTRDAFTWDSSDERFAALARLILLRGEARAAPGPTTGIVGPGGMSILDSYEAEQHVIHLGRSDEPVCWALCGLVSGALSSVLGAEYLVFEDRCVARGHASCRLFARTREGWRQERHDELRYFTPARLDELLAPSLGDVPAALRRTALELKTRRRASKRDRELGIHGLVVRSAVMKKVVDLCVRAARVDSTVLITGESGTGKERVARVLHAESARAGGPFLAVNCGAITESLLESELFGHTRGAFTGASTDRVGLFEAANGGTIFLDEIGETTPGMQIKLLRAVQERVVRRIGENGDRSFDTRIVAATNRDLGQEVAASRFRQDLLYRLKVIEVKIPPLRDRRDDVLPLARHLLADAAARFGRDVRQMSARVVDQLLRYPWPGNVRELGNAMERSVALAQGKVVEVDDLPEEIQMAMPSPGAPASETRPLHDIERDYILAVLDRNRGNQKRTAKQLGIGSATLYRKLKGYGKAVTSSR